MKRTVLVAALMISLIFTLNLAAVAKEQKLPDTIDKIERVRKTGIGCLGISLFGGYATAPAEPSLFGAASPLFRLNSDNKTVFRGLGRESGVAQLFFPTLHSRQNLQNMLSENREARRSLTTFDAQVATGEKIYMISTTSVVTGKIALVAGVLMAFSGNENATTIWKAGVVLWGAGRLGQLGGTIVTNKAFAHLSDAMDTYNEAR